MKTGMTLTSLLEEVKRQTAAKRDFLADTGGQIRLVPCDENERKVALVLLRDGAEALERFEVTDHAHRQISGWLNVPWKYYDRLLTDHPDLVLHQVNALFEREPGARLIRVLDNKCRAFLSNTYRTLDNDVMLTSTLPKLFDKDGNVPANKVLASHISDDDMRIRVVFTDDSLAQTIGTTRDGKPDIVRPGFEMGNGETGRRKTWFDGFFHRGYCDNGCVWKSTDSNFDVSFERRHVGGKLQNVGMEIFSDDTKRKEDAALLAGVGDIMRAMGSREFVNKLGDELRAAKGGTQIAKPMEAVKELAKEVNLRESELDRLLQNLYAEGDLSRYGAMNAVTAIANSNEVSEERSFELQEIGGQLLNMPVKTWERIALAA